MKKIYRKIKPTIILAVFAFCLLNCGGHLQAAHQNQQKDTEYAPGQLVIKLKQDKSLNDIQDLNLKYNVRTPEKVFKDTPSPEKTLKGMNEKLEKLDSSHESWYWQLDKNSQEYKDYAAKIEQEKDDLARQIEAQEKLIARLEQRQKRAPADAQTPELDNIYLLNSDAETNIPAMDAEYSANDAVEYAEPNYVVKAMMSPNDPYYSSSGSWGQSYDDLWGLKKIQAEKAWDISQGEGVVVAVVDSGIDYTHEDIADNIWQNSAETAGNGIDDDGNGYADDVKGYDFANSDSDPLDDHGHGSHVAGIIAATGNNSKGIIGVAYKAKIMAVKGIDKSGSGYDSNLAKALQYAADNGADIINNSWGGSGNSSTIDTAINYAYNKGCVIIAAAGNSSEDALLVFPANSSQVITVASTDSNDNYSNFSNYGSKIDISAPGGNSADSSDTSRTYENILSLRANNTDIYKDEKDIVNTHYYRARGTSMSCPYVSGTAALILSRKSSLNNEEVRQMLRVSADDLGSDGFDQYYGHGRLNAYEAVNINAVCTAKITSPKANVLLKPGHISIKGSANGTNFNNYKLEYTDYLYCCWKEITSKSYFTVTNDLLGSWNIESTGQYHLRLTVTDKDNNTFQDNISTVFINEDLREGWPQYIGTTQSYSTAFVVADINKDGKKEIIVGDNNGKVHVYKDTGAYLESWPIDINNSITSDIVCADTDNDGYLEIFFAANNQYIYGYRYDGTPINGWPQHIQNAYSFCAIAAGDMNHDGAIDIAAFPLSNSENSYTHIFNKNGAILSEWQINSSADLSRSILGLAGPSIGDFDGNETLEIVMAMGNLEEACYYLYVFDYQGNVSKAIKLDGAKLNVTKNSTYTTTNHSNDFSRPVIGDMDNDGDLEIAITRTYKNLGYYMARLFVFSYNKGRYDVITAKDIDSLETTQLALADMDDNGDLEILCGLKPATVTNGRVSNEESKLRVFNHDGSLFLTSENATGNPTLNGSPVIVDINSDNKKEMILPGGNDTADFANNDYLKDYIYNNDGTLYKKYPMPSIETTDNYSCPTVTDIDNDGLTEMIVLYPATGLITIWDLNTTYNSNMADWPMFQHDIYRSGNYDFNPKTADTTAPEGSILLVGNSSGYTKTAQISLSLSASDDTGVTGYYLSENNSTPSADASGWITVTSTASYNADVSYTLSAGDGTKTVYCWYKDTAGNISEQYKASAILDTTTPAIAISNPTSSSTYSTSSSNLNLGGTASDATSGVKEITWKSDKGGSGTASGITSWSVSNISLSKGKNIITVTAKDNAGNEKSTTLNVTYTAAAAPSKPSNLSAYAISTQTVKLIWKDNSNNETGFRIERKAKNSQYNEISVVSANIAVYNDSGLKTHTKYTYRVRAYNNTGSSSYSNIATTTTKKQRPIRK